jgi:hypothetical protein
MATRLPLSLMVALDVDCSTKCSVTSALMNSGGGFSSAMRDPSVMATARRECSGVLKLAD